MSRTNETHEPVGTKREVLRGIALGIASLGFLALLAPSSSALLDPEEALLATLWIAGTALALWWTASLLLCLAASRSSSPLLHVLSERVAMPIARRIATGSLAVGLVALPACGAPEQTAPQMVLVESGVQTTTTATSTTLPLPSDQAAQTVPRSTVPNSTTSEAAPPPVPVTTLDPASAFEQALNAANNEGAAPNLGAAPATSPINKHTVANGDNLWSIAKARLSVMSSTAPSNAEVAVYWRSLIEANRDSLASGNLNLIYPGEVLDLPALPDTGTLSPPPPTVTPSSAFG